MEEIIEKYNNLVQELKLKISELEFQLEDYKTLIEEEKDKRQFYQSIADFTFGWELWFDPDGKIKYCSPSCFDLTGFSTNQIIITNSLSNLLVFESDIEKFDLFLDQSLKQLTINKSLEFRILTRTKQLRWCIINVRGVYDKLGKYIGIRASIQDITKLKRAMGSIRELEAGKEFQNRSKKRLQSQLELKDRELVSFLLQLSQKNEIIAKINNTIQSYPTSPELEPLIKISSLIKEASAQKIDWLLIENQIEKIHPEFFSRLENKHSNISTKDKKLCSYLRLGMSSKEISGLLNITPQSVEIARVRLRKKLKINTKIRLSAYLEKL